MQNLGGAKKLTYKLKKEKTTKGKKTYDAHVQSTEVRKGTKELDLFLQPANQANYQLL